MLEAVEEREHDGVAERVGIDPVERRVEGVRLDGHDEQRDRAVEPRHGLGLRDGRPLAVDQGQPIRSDRLDRALRANADGARANGEHPADPTEAQHCNGDLAHAASVVRQVPGSSQAPTAPQLW